MFPAFLRRRSITTCGTNLSQRVCPRIPFVLGCANHSFQGTAIISTGRIHNCQFDPPTLTAMTSFRIIPPTPFPVPAGWRSGGRGLPSRSQNIKQLINDALEVQDCLNTLKNLLAELEPNDLTAELVVLASDCQDVGYPLTRKFFKINKTYRGFSISSQFLATRHQFSWLTWKVTHRRSYSAKACF